MNPKPPTPPKHPAPPAVMQSTKWESDLTKELSEGVTDSSLEFSSYLGQNFLICPPDEVTGILVKLKALSFEFLVDLTAVDYPKEERRFELIYNLYSFERNERVRVKARITDADKPLSVVDLFATANWLEREVYDMFGIEFAGHPDLRRILLPDEWQGHPLRKDYGILDMDQRWVQENLGIESGQ